MAIYLSLHKSIPPSKQEDIPPRSVKMSIAEIVREAGKRGISYGEYQARRRNDEHKQEEVSS